MDRTTLATSTRFQKLHQKSPAFSFESTRQRQKEVDDAADKHDLGHHNDHSYTPNVTEQPEIK